jgi:hypothetical protein
MFNRQVHAGRQAGQAHRGETMTDIGMAGTFRLADVFSKSTAIDGR